MDNLLLYNKFSRLSDEMKSEVLLFIDFLLNKSSQKEKKNSIPQFGSAKGIFKIKKGFDDPIDDFRDYME